MKRLSFYLNVLVNFLLVSLGATLILKISEISKMILAKLGLIHSKIPTSENPIPENAVVLILLAFISTLLLFYMLWLILKFRKTIYNFKTDSIFSEKNSSVFNTVGKGLIYYSAIKFIIKLVEKSFDELVVGESLTRNWGRNMGTSIVESIPLLVIALFLLIIAQLIKDGYQLKN